MSNPTSNPTRKDVLVVIGAGSIGQAIARRTGPGKQVLLADFNETTLQAAATALETPARPARYLPYTLFIGLSPADYLVR